MTVTAPPPAGSAPLVEAPRPPVVVAAAVVSAIATWMVFALWPPPVLGTAFVAGATGVTAGIAVLRSRSRTVWIVLIAAVGFRGFADATEVGAAPASYVIVLLTLDATALTLLLHPTTRRWVRTTRSPALPPAVADVVAEPGDFRFEWRSTIHDWERVYSARRRAEGVARRQLALGALGLVVVAPGIVHGDPVAIVLAVAAVAYAAGLLDRLNRRFTYWPKQTDLDLVSCTTIRDDAIFDTVGYTSKRWEWPYWAAYLLVDDMLVLFSGVKGRVNALAVGRRGMQQPERWDELISYVASRVPPHPGAHRVRRR